MKNSMIILRITLLIALFFTALNCTFSQSKTFAKHSQSNAVPEIAIKVYDNNNGLKTLLAFNPNHHSFFYYETPPFSVQWYQDGKLVGEQARLENVCGQIFTVIVSNYATGRVAHSSYLMGCKNRN